MWTASHPGHDAKYEALGRCFTFDPHIKLTQPGLSHIAFKINETDKNLDFTVFTHPKNQLLNQKQRRSLRWSDLSNKYITAKFKIINYVNLKRKPCIENFDEQIRSIILTKMSEEYGCICPYFNYPLPNIAYSQMTNDKLDYCNTTDKAEGTFAILKKYTSQLAIANDIKRNDSLLPPCQKWKPDLKDAQPSSLQWNTWLEQNKGLVFEFQDETKVYDQVIEYTNLNFLSEVGGYMGLLLGYSIWQLTAVGFARAKRMCRSAAEVGDKVYQLIVGAIAIASTSFLLTLLLYLVTHN